jgi:hypothetical protein
MVGLGGGRWARWRRPCYAAMLFVLATSVAGERTDSTKSTASGNGLQYATAGVLAEFTVTAKVYARHDACCRAEALVRAHILRLLGLTRSLSMHLNCFHSSHL